MKLSRHYAIASMLVGLAVTDCDCSDETTNQAPNVTLAIAPESPTTADDITVNATTNDPDGDTVSLKFVWTVDGGSTTQETNTIESALTSRDQRWSVTVTPNDGKTNGEAVTAEVLIANSLPTVESVALTPDPATSADTLAATAGATNDADGDQVTLSYRWLVDGSVAQEGTDTSLASGTAVKNQSVQVEVVPNDGTADGSAVASNTVVLGNSIPSITGVTIDPPAGGAQTTFGCRPSGWSDADGDTEQYNFRWSVNTTYLAVSTSSLSSPHFVTGDVIQCEVTPTDGEDDGTTMMSQQVTVSNEPPSITSVLISPNDPREGDTITATISGWHDPEGAAEGYTYEWRVAGLFVAQSPTLGSSLFDKGDDVFLRVTPTDGEVNGTPVDSNTVTVANTVPSITSASLSPSPATSNDDLATTPSGWSDPDPADQPGYLYAWFVNTVEQTGQTSMFLASQYFVRGDVVYATATPDDGTDLGTTVTTPSITIQNSPPTAPAVQITPANPGSESELTCIVSTPSVDGDGDPITYSYSWTRDGAPTTETSSVVLASVTRPRELWRCIVTPNDSVVDGPSGSADAMLSPECTSLLLDGTASRVSVPGSSDFVYGSAATIEAWIAWNGIANAQAEAAVFSHRPASEALQIGIFQGNTTQGPHCPGRAVGEPYFIWGAAGAACIRSTKALAANRWNHIAGVYANGVATLYLNGRFVQSSTVGGVMDAVTALDAAGIGALSDGSGGWFGGRISGVRVSSNARYGAEFIPARVFAADSNTIALWNLDTDNVTVAEDISGNNDGSIFAGAWDPDGPICDFDPEGITNALATAICNWTTRCEPAIYGFFDLSEATCQSDRFSSLYHQYVGIAHGVAQARVDYSEANLQACIDAYNTADCELGVGSACDDLLSGTQNVGQPCFSSVECVDTAFCGAGTFGQCATCIARAQATQDCSNAVCAEGTVCLTVGTNLLCINDTLELNQSCGTVTTGLCRGRLQCVGAAGAGSCRRPSGPGAACDPLGETNSFCNIYQNQICDQNVCAPVTWVAPGAACSATNRCDEHAYCDQTLSQCLNYPAAGQVCYQGECASGTFCNTTNSCQAEAGRGGGCNASGECTGNFFCINHLCEVYTWIDCD